MVEFQWLTKVSNLEKISASGASNMSWAGIAIRGAYFTSVSLAVRQIISFATVIFAARVLSPSDFGLVAIVFVVIGFAQVIGDIGFSAGLVRTQTSSSVAINTVFWLSLSTGGVLAACVFFAAPLAAKFYKHDSIEIMLQVSAIGLVINFCLPVPLAVLQKNLGYREISLSQALGSLVGAICAISFLLAGYGAWGLVFQPVVGNLVFLIFMLRQARWFPRFEFSLESVRSILVDGLNLLGASLMQYSRGNVDSALIGRALSTSDLGIYTMARTILYAPNYLITSVASRVIFPLLSKVQNSKLDVEEVILLSVKKIALLSFPLYVGLWVTAPDIIQLAFGPKWVEMVLLLRLMIAAALVQSIGNISSPILIALGASRINFYLSLGGLVVYICVLVVAVNISLFAVSLGYTLVNIFIGLIAVWAAISVSQIAFFKLLKTIVSPFFVSLAMGIIMLLAQAAIPLDSMFRLGFVTAVGILVYLALVFLTERKLIRQIRDAFS